jgi:hypothetical protein
VTAPADPPHFLVELAPLPSAGTDAPPGRRLARVLKALLRWGRFRRVSVAEVPAKAAGVAFNQESSDDRPAGR